MAGMPYPPKCVLWAVHLCSVGAAETAAPTKLSVGSVHSVGENSTTPWGKSSRRKTKQFSSYFRFPTSHTTVRAVPHTAVPILDTIRDMPPLK